MPDAQPQSQPVNVSSTPPIMPREDTPVPPPPPPPAPAPPPPPTSPPDAPVETGTPPPEPVKKDRNWKMILAIVVVTILLIGSAIGVYAFKSVIKPAISNLGMNLPGVNKSEKENNGTTTITPSVTSPEQTAKESKKPQKEWVAKYFVDSDGDHIADFIERELKTDPNKNECMAKAGCGDQDIKPLESVEKNVLFILDSSGSMALQAGGEPKMTSAKNALKEYVAKADPGINIGLMVYGHEGSNKKVDKLISCAGIEVVYPLGPVNKTAFNNAVDSFSATGWTPIADSLKKAETEVFAGKEKDNNYIVLISDGVETCNGDPVAVAKDIKSNGIATINVIGFAVSSNERAQLEKISEAGGGQYYAVSNMSQLSRAINDINGDLIKFMGNSRCVNENFIEYQGCLSLTFMSYMRWSNTKFLDLYNHGSKDEAVFLRDEYDPIVRGYYDGLSKVSKDDMQKKQVELDKDFNKLEQKYLQFKQNNY